MPWSKGCRFLSGMVAVTLSSKPMRSKQRKKSKEWLWTVPRPWYLWLATLRLPSWNSSRVTCARTVLVASWGSAGPRMWLVHYRSVRPVRAMSPQINPLSNWSNMWAMWRVSAPARCCRGRTKAASSSITQTWYGKVRSNRALVLKRLAWPHCLCMDDGLVPHAPVLKYVATYDMKFSSSTQTEWLQGEGSDYSAAVGVLRRMRVLEPEMWLTLAQERFPQAILSGSVVDIMTPTLNTATKSRLVVLY